MFSNQEQRTLGRKRFTEMAASFVTAIQSEDLLTFLKAITGTTTIGDLVSAVPEVHKSLALGIASGLSGLLSVGSSENTSHAAKIIRAFYEVFAELAGSHTLGELTGLGGSRLEALAAAVSDILVELSVKESANVLRSLDIRAMVVAKINSLDMIEVERMLLRVIERELRAVTYFGGVLGAAIGLVQSLLFLIR